MWEFPGGKLEPDETPLEGLARELHEELDIRIASASAMPLVRVPWTYAGRALLLDAWQVGRWQGAPRSVEGQALRWHPPQEVDHALLAPADRVILQTLVSACCR
jgi:8-oxo-dGTP diphosphatase